MLQRVGGGYTRKARHGGCGCDLMRGGSSGGGGNNDEKKMGAKAKSHANAMAKTLRNREKRREEKIRAKRQALLEARRKQFVAQNVGNVLNANAANNGRNFIDKLIENPEYADEICDKFCEFLDDLNEMRDEADAEGNYGLSGEISNKKAEIAENLLTIFGKKKVNAPAAAAAAAAGPANNHQVVNNFGANLANILSGLKL